MEQICIAVDRELQNFDPFQKLELTTRLDSILETVAQAGVERHDEEQGGAIPLL